MCGRSEAVGVKNRTDVMVFDVMIFHKVFRCAP